MRAARVRATGWFAWLALSIVALLAVAASRHTEVSVAFASDAPALRAGMRSEALVAVSQHAQPALRIAEPSPRERLPAPAPVARSAALARELALPALRAAGDKHLNFLRFCVRRRIARRDSDEPPIG